MRVDQRRIAVCVVPRDTQAGATLAVPASCALLYSTAVRQSRPTGSEHCESVAGCSTLQRPQGIATDWRRSSSAFSHPHPIDQSVAESR